MACYHPLTAVVLANEGLSGKKVISLSKRAISLNSAKDNFILLPCGNCIGCREDRARTWALRCVHEASLYEKNCFITLTYNDKYLPKGGSLQKPASKKGDQQSDFQLFMKRLRKKFGNGIRYYMCAEYGSQFSRPHYHACLFNFDFPIQSKEHPDGKVLWKQTQGGNLYRSPVLESLWTDPRSGESLGYCSVGSVTFDSAAYVARYIIKKINGDLAPDHYQGRQPEYSAMSRRPGIGKEWFKKFKQSDVALAYREGFITLNGKKYKIPKYYDQNYEITDPDHYNMIKEIRKDEAKKSPDNKPPRLAARKLIHQTRNQMRKKSLDQI